MAKRAARPASSASNHAPRKAGTKEATVLLTMGKITKGAARFHEIDPETRQEKKTDEDGALVSTPYFRKAAMAEMLGCTEVPTDIEITVRVIT